ncbi:MAG: 3-deoxy-7-phosphoheptulonate synthase [Gammaproteobacteria bacterium]
MLKTTDDLRIKNIRPLIPPAVLLEKLPLNQTSAQLIIQTREAAANIMTGKDDRLLVVVGPCSIHDPTAALEYANHLRAVLKKWPRELCLVMRVYFEKPRTILGWKGLINDPHLDGSFAINQGLNVARRLLLNITQLGVPAGTEFLDTIIPQFLSDLVVWGAIGARTVESQIHRELASGLSMPIGFKNGTTGNVQAAIDAVRAAHHPHHFLGVTKDGIAAIMGTSGNDTCHIILRGSSHGPNYDPESIAEVIDALKKTTLPACLMVDCSHGNSAKDYKRQIIVAASLAEQIAAGNHAICGVMLESHLVAGKQTLENDKPLKYGQSITDACLSWQETVPLLEQLASAVRQRRKVNKSTKTHEYENKH